VSEATTALPLPTPRRRRRRVLQYLVVGIGCLALVEALVGDKGLLAMLKARDDYRALQVSLTQIRADNARLRDEARRLREDPMTIEDLARRELGLIRPGEKLFILKDVAPSDASSKR
jgi:cell division protein FtsB